MAVSLTGVVNDNIANGEVKSYTIKFEKEFNETPTVTISNIITTPYGSLQNLVVSRIGFSYTKVNSATVSGVFNFTWLAESDKGFAN